MLNYTWMKMFMATLYVHLSLFLLLLVFLDVVQYKNKHDNWFFNKYKYRRLKMTLIWLIMVVATNRLLVETLWGFRETLIYNTTVASVLTLSVWLVVIWYGTSSPETRLKYRKWVVMDFSCINILWYSFLYSLVLDIFSWGYLYSFDFIIF